MKAATKKKLTLIRQTRARTGGEPTDVHLSQLDLKIVSLLGINNLNGDINLGELGFETMTKCMTMINCLFSFTIFFKIEIHCSF